MLPVLKLESLRKKDRSSNWEQPTPPPPLHFPPPQAIAALRVGVMMPPGGRVRTALHVTCLSYVCFFLFFFSTNASTRLDAGTSRRVVFNDFFLSFSLQLPSLPSDNHTFGPADSHLSSLPSLILSSAFISPLAPHLPGVRSQTEREEKLAARLIPSPPLSPLRHAPLCPASPPTDVSLLLLLSLPRCSPRPLYFCCSDPPTSRFLCLLCLIHDKLRDFALACSCAMRCIAPPSSPVLLLLLPPL